MTFWSPGRARRFAFCKKFFRLYYEEANQGLAPDAPESLRQLNRRKAILAPGESLVAGLNAALAKAGAPDRMLREAERYCFLFDRPASEQEMFRDAITHLKNCAAVEAYFAISGERRLPVDKIPVRHLAGIQIFSSAFFAWRSTPGRVATLEFSAFHDPMRFFLQKWYLFDRFHIAAERIDCTIVDPSSGIEFHEDPTQAPSPEEMLRTILLSHAEMRDCTAFPFTDDRKRCEDCRFSDYCELLRARASE
ncbi:MAG: hypothetical protein PHS41_04680 [Victivallaceae bacterium]|nr:hypothetical protein [Victivallaceae bacterium]